MRDGRLQTTYVARNEDLAWTVEGFLSAFKNSQQVGVKSTSSTDQRLTTAKHEGRKKEEKIINLTSAEQGPSTAMHELKVTMCFSPYA